MKGSLFDFSPMRSHAFLVYCFAAFFVYLGYYSCKPNLVSNWPHLTHAKVTTYVAALAINIGVSTSFSFYLVSICNACSGVSRITSGLTADRTGKDLPFVVMLYFCLTTYRGNEPNDTFHHTICGGVLRLAFCSR